jgi:hypothetical protein
MTLKNAGIAALVSVFAFLAISLRSEMQNDDPKGYGRLVDRALPAVEQKPLEIIREAPAPVADQTVPDPMLVEPLAREQWLRDQALVPVDTAGVAVDVQPMEALPYDPRPEGDTEIVIVGGPGGLQAVRRPARKPVLSGGFGRTP